MTYLWLKALVLGLKQMSSSVFYHYDRVALLLVVPWLAFVGAGSNVLELGKKTLSALQHFSAGIIFAALAIELLPLVLNDHELWVVSIGFALGVGLMLALKWSPQLKRLQSQLWVAYFIDFFIDGMLISLAVLAGQHSGLLVAIAVTVELFFLGFTLPKSARKLRFRIGCGVLLGGGLVLLAYPLLTPMILGGLLSFGCAALLFLVAEELLVQAHHDTEDGPWLTAMLFVGFWLMCVLDMVNN